MRNPTGVLLTFLAIFSSSFSQAKERNPWTHFGLRPLGMGNAYVAIADDYNALFYNPAGLARLDSWDGEFLNPALTVSQKATDLMSDASDLNGIDDTLGLIEENAGENVALSFSLTPHLIFPHFGFGVGLNTTLLSMTFHRDLSVDVKSGIEIIAPISFAMNFLDDRLSLGATLKGRAIGYVDREFSMEDLEALGSSDDTAGGEEAQELSDFIIGGYGAGVDFGLLFTPSKVMEPTLGVSITDLGGTHFTEAKVGSDEPLGKPPVVLPSVNVGLSLKPFTWGSSYLRTAVDMHSINQPYSFSQKLQLGVEYGLGQFLKIQGGLYKGYFTSGIQLDAGIVNLKIVTYAEELGTVAGYQASRRYALQLKLLL